MLAGLGLLSHPSQGADVMSYSIIKGHFLYQTGPEELVSDPLFGFSFLGSLDLFVMTPPVLRFLSRSGNELPEIEVVADPEGTVVLQGSPNLQTWSNIATNTSSSGTHVFRLPPETGADHFFRAFQN